jgi:Rubrerythrin
MRTRRDVKMAITRQYVCPVCSYNMIGACPEQCPFWGAYHNAENPLARPFPFDRKFTGASATWFSESDGMHFNPCGPEEATRQAGVRLGRIIENRDFAKVCAWNYVTEYASWRDAFKRLIEVG